MDRRLVIPGHFRSGTLAWTNASTGKEVALIGYEASLTDPKDARMRLHYTTTRWHDGSKVASDYRVSLTTTQPHFGGVRWWFICPLSGRRTRTLYLPNGATRFASRQAYRLPYQSQRDSRLDRSHNRQRRLYRKLGASYASFDEIVPKRPKGMRHKTYARIEAQLEDAFAMHDIIWAAGARRILARYDRLRKQ